MFWFWLLFLVLLGCLALLLPAIRGREFYMRYRDTRSVVCPETHRQVAVRVDALHAAITGFFKKPDLRLAQCTLWPGKVYCDQQCIPDASRQGEVEVPEEKTIYHLPVLIAAFVSWVIGALWHSQYMFRTRWTEAVGLTPPEVRQLVRWWTPHVVSVTACLLFAYGVAWLLTWSESKGIRRGILAAVFLWIAVGLAVVFASGFTGIPGELLVLEAGYTLLASIVVGTIMGGFSGRPRVAQG